MLRNYRQVGTSVFVKLVNLLYRYFNHRYVYEYEYSSVKKTHISIHNLTCWVGLSSSNATLWTEQVFGRLIEISVAVGGRRTNYFFDVAWSNS